jgi:prepilin signal peptidase PulO-like enzyme (type II secretory pathway)
MIELVPAALAISAAIVASYTDLKSRIIPDKLTYPLILFGVFFHLVVGVVKSDMALALSGLVGTALSFGIGYLLWLAGGWAGGDVKLFAAFGALIPSYPFSLFPAPYSGYLLFPLTILFNSLIVVAFALPFYVALCKLGGRGAFYRSMRITELKEGAIPAETIFEKDGKIERVDKFSLTAVFSRPKYDRTFTNPRSAAGLTNEEIQELKKLVSQGKIEDEIKIKIGVPFAPVLAAGLLVAVSLGDLYWLILSIFA